MPRKKVKRTRGEVDAICRNYDDSKFKSVSAFCKQYHIAESQFYQWRKKQPGNRMPNHTLHVQEVPGTMTQVQAFAAEKARLMQIIAVQAIEIIRLTQDL